MSIVLQPRTPRADGLLQFSPASLLGGVALARTLDAVNEYFLFIRQRVFGIYSPIASNPEYGLSILYNEELKHCKWLYYELRARVSPEIEVLFDHQSSHSNKERVWKEIYDRIGFEVTNPYRFNRINPHRHFHLDRAVGIVVGLEIPEFYPNNLEVNHRAVPWEDGGFTDFKIHERRTPSGLSTSNAVNADNNTSSTVNLQTRRQASHSEKRFYDPFCGWIYHLIPARSDNCPRPRHPRKLNVSSDVSTQDQASRVDESNPSPRLDLGAEFLTRPDPKDDVFGPQPRTCAVCNIIFKANTFVSEVHLNVNRGLWRKDLLQDYPSVARDIIHEEWALKNPEFVAERRRGYHPDRNQQYGKPIVYPSEAGIETIAKAVLDFISDRVRDARLEPTVTDAAAYPQLKTMLSNNIIPETGNNGTDDSALVSGETNDTQENMSPW
ncbi:uncharacterized protein F4817DRAFT_315624 [Daldinia loculata]|uniref:uncharacterized protein n=1 Tax=Daldinia loculata TaxID=103429 RepID=UPI0020C4D03A|nr:uncharacterized protein F4817DRAFT_315624 [Daldinia loculata]KAI1647758.1 hypothetical protein F4817DRAFT_315624 [Daldinia loculata]